MSDFKQALPLLAQERSEFVIVDKGYDSREIEEYVEKNRHARVVTPSKANRKKPRT